MFDKYPWLGWVVVGAVELVAVAIAAVLWHFGFVRWYALPLSLLIPPGILLLVIAWVVTGSEAERENLFR